MSPGVMRRVRRATSPGLIGVKDMPAASGGDLPATFPQRRAVPFPRQSAGRAYTHSRCHQRRDCPPHDIEEQLMNNNLSGDLARTRNQELARESRSAARWNTEELQRQRK